jgi:hypothetical protein
VLAASTRTGGSRACASLSLSQASACEHSAWLQDARALREHAVQRAEIDEDVRRDHEIGRGIGPADEKTRQPRHGELVVERSAVCPPLAPRPLDHARREIAAGEEAALLPDRFPHQPCAAAEVVDRLEPEGAAGVAAAAGERRLQQLGRVILQGLGEMAVEAVSVGVEERTGEVLGGRLLGRDRADAREVEPRAEMVVGIEVEALPPGRRRVLPMPQRLLRQPVEMPGGGEVVGLRQGLVEDLDAGLRVSLPEGSLGPVIAAVQRRIAGTGGMRGRGLFDHARGSI